MSMAAQNHISKALASGDDAFLNGVFTPVGIVAIFALAPFLTLWVGTDLAAHSAPVGRVIVEGMLARRPVVATRAGGVVEIIEHDENGLLCEPGDAHALAALQTDPALRERLVAGGHATALRRFGTKSYVGSGWGRS